MDKSEHDSSINQESGNKDSQIFHEHVLQPEFDVPIVVNGPKIPDELDTVFDPS